MILVRNYSQGGVIFIDSYEKEWVVFDWKLENNLPCHGLLKMKGGEPSRMVTRVMDSPKKCGVYKR